MTSKADLIVAAPRIMTEDPALPEARVVAVRDRRIAAVGGEEVFGLAGPETVVRRFDRGLVVPGLADSHVHLAGYAAALERVKLENAASIQDALERIRSHLTRRIDANDVPGTAPGGPPAGSKGWILGRGWDPNRWSEGWPTRSHLDPLIPDRPAAFRSKDGHSYWLNTRALERAGIDERTPCPDGGAIELDPATGTLTGILRENALDLVDRVIRAQEEAPGPDRIRAVMAQANRLGITAVHDVDGARFVSVYRRLVDSAAISVRILLMVPEPYPDRLPDRRDIESSGRGFLFPGHVKALADGALGSSTAWMSEPYRDNPANTGMPTLSRGELAERTRWSAGQGYPMAVHAIGDEAVRLCVDVFASPASRPGGNAPPHRIEHVQCARSEEIAAIGRQRIAASMQPSHFLSDRDMIVRKLGSRSAIPYPFASLERAGAVLAFGSDAPIEDWNPFTGIYAATVRPCEGFDPAPLAPRETLAVARALRAYTAGAAEAAGLGHILGRLAEGYAADFAVLDRDILGIESGEIAATHVVLTVVDGRIVYEAEPGAASSATEAI